MNAENLNNQAEKQLNDLLDEYIVEPASSQLHERIITTITESPTPRSNRIYGLIQDFINSVGGWRVAAPALALSFIIGITANIWSKEITKPDDVTTIWELSMLSTDEDYL